MSVRELAQQVRDYWISIGVRVQPGATEEGIAAFEALHGLRLPDELRDYYSVVNGFEDWEWDNEMTEFCSLSRASEEASESGTTFNGQQGIVLADYCYRAFYFVALREGNAASPCSIGLLCSPEPIRVLSTSLAEFLAAYLEDPREALFRKA